MIIFSITSVRTTAYPREARYNLCSKITSIIGIKLDVGARIIKNQMIKKDIHLPAEVFFRRELMKRKGASTMRDR